MVPDHHHTGRGPPPWDIHRRGSGHTTHPTLTGPDRSDARNGSPAKATLRYPDGSERALPSKGAFDVPPGGQVILEAPGSGGYGKLTERNTDSKARDIEDGYLKEG